MKLLVSALALANLALPALAQDSKPTSRPVQPAFEKPKKSRNGGYLGLFFEEVVVDGHAGLHLLGVQHDSDAARLGFRKGDVIVAVSRREFRNGDDFVKALWFQDRQAKQQRGRGQEGAPAKSPERSITVKRAGKDLVLRAGLADLDRSPAVGAKAPDFTLSAIDGKSDRQLSRLWAGKPVVLVFGSYT